MKKHRKILTIALLTLGAVCAGGYLNSSSIHASSIMQQIQTSQATRLYNYRQNNNHPNQLNGNVAVSQPPRQRINVASSARYHPAVDAYDISQYQGYVSPSSARRLKHETRFMVLRAQGGSYADYEFQHNQHLMRKDHIPYGVYSYSYYTSPYNASLEARSLYNRAPHADFYANDIEENDAGSVDDFNRATKVWAKTLKGLTNKPVVLYSGLYFMDNNTTPATRNKYNAIWLAAYSSVEPYAPFHYDLWQYGTHYSNALHENIDADRFPVGNHKPLSFWTGKNVRGHHHKRTKHIKKIVVVQPQQSPVTAQDKALNKSSKKLTKQIKTLHITKRSHWKTLVKRNDAITSYINQIQQTMMTNSDMPMKVRTRLGNDLQLLSKDRTHILHIENYKLQAQQSKHAKRLAKQQLRQQKLQRKRTLKRLHRQQVAQARAEAKAIARAKAKYRRRTHKARRPRKRAIHFVSGHYRSNRIHMLKAKRPIVIYNYYNPAYHNYIPAGSKIKRVHFLTYRKTNGKYSTRAVGFYRGIWVEFTSSKKDVKR